MTRGVAGMSSTFENPLLASLVDFTVYKAELWAPRTDLFTSGVGDLISLRRG
jgi:hypothetical protein